MSKRIEFQAVLSGGTRNDRFGSVVTTPDGKEEPFQPTQKRIGAGLSDSDIVPVDLRQLPDGFHPSDFPVLTPAEARVVYEEDSISLNQERLRTPRQTHRRAIADEWHGRGRPKERRLKKRYVPGQLSIITGVAEKKKH